MTIVIVEDDYLQADWIYQKLNEAIPNANLEQVSTEGEFRSRFEEIVSKQPDVFVMDVMLRWADPDPNLSIPEEVEKEGFYRAGLRCEAMVAADSRTSNVPVILYTVLERSDLNSQLITLPEQVQYLPKHSDISPLVQKIVELTRQPQQA
jgi:hypothetical protein